jgi:hypothetical protein
LRDGTCKLCVQAVVGCGDKSPEIPRAGDIMRRDAIVKEETEIFEMVRSIT